MKKILQRTFTVLAVLIVAIVVLSKWSQRLHSRIKIPVSLQVGSFSVFHSPNSWLQTSDSGCLPPSPHADKESMIKEIINYKNNGDNSINNDIYYKYL